jgi:hypothetical protein
VLQIIASDTFTPQRTKLLDCCGRIVVEGFDDKGPMHSNGQHAVIDAVDIFRQSVHVKN